MKTTSPQRSSLALLPSLAAILFAVALTTGPLLAANQTWGGAGGNGLWQNGANWAGGAPPAAGDTLVFVGNTRTASTNDFPVGTAFSGLSFSTPAGAFTLWGNAVRLDGDLGNNQPLLTETVRLPIALGGNRVADVAKDASLTLAGALSGGPQLTKKGAGVLTLGAANSFAGPLTILAGTVSVSSDANLGAAPSSQIPSNLTLDGGALRSTANLTLDVNRGIAVGPASGSGSGRIEVDSGTTLTYRGVISNNGGTGGLTKAGPGTLILSGANVYTGPTSNRVGNLVLDFAHADAPQDNIISSSSALSLGGENTGIGTVNNIQVTMNGRAGGTSSQSFNGTTFDVGSAVIRANSGAGGAANLQLGNLGHLPGGAVTFVPPKITGGSGDINTTSQNSNGILGGWATFSGAGQSVNSIVVATNWASIDTGGQIVPYKDFVAYSSGTIASQVAADDNLIFNTSTGQGSSILVDADHEPGAGTVTDVNTIMLNALPSFGINIGSNNVLRLGKNGGIFLAAVPSTANNNFELGNGTDPGNNPGANAGQNVGTLTAGGAPDTDGELVFTVNSSSQTANGSIYVEAAITDNGKGKVSVVKTGPGPMKFRGHNSFSGNMYIIQGRIQMAGSELPGGAAVTANPDGFGTGDIYVLPGGQAFPSGAGGNATMPAITNNWYIAGNGVSDNVGAIRLSGVFSNGVITLIGDARLGGGGAASGVHIYDKITGRFNLDFGATGNSGSGGNGAIIHNEANDWSGNTTIVGRTGSTAGNTRLALGASGVIPDGFGKGNVVLGNSGNTASTCTLDLNGFDETINGLISTGNAANDFVQNSAGGTTATLTLGNNDQTATFAGTIQDSAGVVAITKIGRGVQALTGVNTYSGVTTVNEGTLALSGAGSVAGSAQILVNPGATLDVSGVAGGFTHNSVAITNGTLVISATADPGIGSLVLQDSTLRVSLNTATTNVVAPNLTTGGATNLVNVSAVSGVTRYPATFTVIKYGAATLGTGLNFGLGAVPTSSTRGYFSNDTASSSIVLVLLDGPKPLTWTGTAGFDWDLVTTNWLAFGTTPTAFMNADSAWFTDSASTNQVSLTTVLRPGSVRVDCSSMDYTFVGSGGLSGDGSLLKDGTGTLTLANSGPNDFTGGITISNGTVRVGDNGATGSLPPGSLVNFGSLLFNRSDDLTVSSDVSGTGTVTQDGPGTTTLRGANTYDGLSIVAQGVLRVGSAGALGSNLGGTVVSNGAALDVNGINLAGEPVTVSGSGPGGAGAILNSGPDQINALQNVTLTGDTVFGGPSRWDIRGGAAALNTGATAYNLTKVGSNQVSLVGISVDSLARIDVREGTFAIETSTVFKGPSVPVVEVAAGATLQLYNLVDPLNNSVTLRGNGSTTTLNNGAGANTLAGPVTLNGSCLFNAGGTSLTVGGSLGGSGGLAKLGGAQLILMGATTYSGPTAVSNGTLIVSTSKGAGAGMSVYGGTLAGMGPIAEPVAVFPGGSISPGDPASLPATALIINNSLVLAGTAVMDVNKFGTDFSSSDSISGVTALTFGGTLQLVLTGDPLALNDSIKLFTFASATGSFAAITPAPGPGLAWDTSQLAVTGTLSVKEAPKEISIGNITVSGSNLVIGGTGGAPGGAYYVLTATNLVSPVIWVPVATNSFDASGAFSFSSEVSADTPSLFFRLQLPQN